MQIIKPNIEEIEEYSKTAFYHTKAHKCKLCGIEFDYGQSNQKYCNLCKIKLNCPECHKDFILDYTKLSGQAAKRLFNSINNNEEIIRFCSHRCFLLNHNKSEIKYCKECKKDTLHGACGCLTCHNKNLNQIKFCNKCQKETMHAGSQCIFCHNQAENVGFKKGYDPNRGYGNAEPNFTEKDGILFYKGTEWNKYKDSFKSNNVNIDDFDEYNGFWQKTYRTEENNITGQDAMEYELVEKNIKWFVYIKFYLNEINNIIPIVCGKSGSKLVNPTGSDLKFDYQEYKPARKFLLENNYKWYKEQIYIIPCKSEEKAYELEKEIQEKYKLFRS